MRQTLRFLLTLVCLVQSTWLYSQTDAHEINGPLIFHAQAQTVVVDVVVTDRNGQPVQGLQREDFLVSEDNKPQTITSFEEHSGASAPTLMPELPPNIFTNAPRVKQTDSVTIILLDSLNTRPEDLNLVQDQTLKYIKDLKPAEPVAIFVMGKQLRLIQDFTVDPALLTAALSHRKGEASLLKPEAELVSDEQTLNEPGESKEPGSSVANRVFLGPVQAEQTASQTDYRVKATIEGLQELARYLTAVPGRKNVLWISGAFPQSVLPDLNLSSPFSSSFPTVRNYGDEVRRTDALLATARVAIYPVAAQGLITSSSDITGAATTPEAVRMEQYLSQHDTEMRNPEQATMDQIARETGGIAFHDVNGLSGKLTRLLDQGSYFYTLTYTPTSSEPESKYRKIEVKLPTKTYTLNYRSGYYGAGKQSTQAGTGDHPLLSFMHPGIPSSTQIRFTVRAQPEAGSATKTDGKRTQAGDNHKLKGPLTRFTVELGIPAKDLLLDTASDGARRGGIESMLIAYDKNGKPQNWVHKRFDLHWDATQYGSVQIHGIHLRMEIDIPKTAVYLQCGVYDQLSNQAGTLEIPFGAILSQQTAASESFNKTAAPSPVGDAPSTSTKGGLATSLTSDADSPDITPRSPGSIPPTPAAGDKLPQSYRSVTTYLDYPLERLKAVIPALDGLKYDANPDHLSFILSRLAQTIDDVLPKLPNLVSREEVFHGAQGPGLPTSVFLGGSTEIKPFQEYKYLIICNRTPDGATKVEESRSELSGQPVDNNQTLIGNGFAYQWLLFSKANQTEFEFRYLGEQHIDGKKTFVVAFAQKPERVTIPARFVWGGKPIPIFYQGVLWIDQSTSNIILIRTDLLEPLPSLQLLKLTTELHFSPVRIRDLGANFWLPREVHIIIQQTKTAAEEDHRYSDYHLYQANVRMVPSP